MLAYIALTFRKVNFPDTQNGEHCYRRRKPTKLVVCSWSSDWRNNKNVDIEFKGVLYVDRDIKNVGKVL